MTVAFSLCQTVSLPKAQFKIPWVQPKNFVALLIDLMDLPAIYPALCQAFEFTSFKAELHRLLKAFSRDLAEEASIPIEKESVRFVSPQRRRISYSVCQEVFGLKHQTLFEHRVHSQQREQDAKERIEQFLRDAAQPKGVDTEDQTRVQRGQNSGDDSSDDEGLGTFSNLQHVKKFLIKSKAFDKLRINIKQLGVPQETGSRQTRHGIFLLFKGTGEEGDGGGQQFYGKSQ
jgi:hypothetical protein